MVICPNCGKENGTSFRFCMGCGGAMPKRTSPPLALAPSAAATEPLTWTRTAKPPTRSRLELTALAIDGTMTGVHPLPEGPSVFGRNLGGPFTADVFLSRSHGSFTPRGDRLLVRDEASLNGIYRRLQPKESAPLSSGQCFRVGQQLLRFEALATKPPDADNVAWLGASSENILGRVVLVHGRETSGNAAIVPKSGLQIGREEGAILFPDDPYVSGKHCRLNVQGDQIVLVDLESSNGTFVRLIAETEVGPGEQLLLGKLLFRVGLAAL